MESARFLSHYLIVVTTFERCAMEYKWVLFLIDLMLSMFLRWKRSSLPYSRAMLLISPNYSFFFICFFIYSFTGCAMSEAMQWRTAAATWRCCRCVGCAWWWTRGMRLVSGNGHFFVFGCIWLCLACFCCIARLSKSLSDFDWTCSSFAPFLFFLLQARAARICTLLAWQNSFPRFLPSAAGSCQVLRFNFISNLNCVKILSFECNQSVRLFHE